MHPTLEHLKTIVSRDLSSENHLMDVYRAYANRQKIKRTFSQEKYVNRLNPFSRDFFTPISPLFLFDETNEFVLTDQEYYLVRDGLYPLLNFFHYKPEPKNIESYFFIHQHLSSFVPEAWKNQVAFYNYETKLIPDLKQKVILTGQFNNNFMSLSSFEKQLEDLKNTLPHHNEFLALLIHSEDIFLAEELGLSHIFFYMKSLMKSLGCNIDFYTMDQLKGLSLEGFNFVDFNENLLTLSDNFVFHLLLSKKVAPLTPWAIECFDDDIIIPCSEHHSLRLSFKVPSWTKPTEDKIKAFKKIIRLDEHTEKSESYLGLSPDFFLFTRDLAKEYVPLQKNAL